MSRQTPHVAFPIPRTTQSLPPSPQIIGKCKTQKKSQALGLGAGMGMRVPTDPDLVTLRVQGEGTLSKAARLLLGFKFKAQPRLNQPPATQRPALGEFSRGVATGGDAGCPCTEGATCRAHSRPVPKAGWPTLRLGICGSQLDAGSPQECPHTVTQGRGCRATD